MKKPDDEDKAFVTMAIMVEPDLKTAMEEVAEKEERSVSFVARRVLNPAFKRKGKKHGR